MRQFTADFIVPRLEYLFQERTIPKANSFRIFGIPESELGEKIVALNLSPELTISYRPQFPEVLLELAAKTDGSLDILEDACNKVRSLLGSGFIFSESANDSLAHIVANELIENKQTFACAESCSGGRLSNMLTSIPGASKYFTSSVVSYSNEAKIEFLEISEDLIQAHGAVSSQCAIKMAEAIRKKNNADFGLSITGIAGPDGGTPEKPVGTVWVACAMKAKTDCWLLNLPWSREMITTYSCHFALDRLRRELLSIEEELS
ncbi:UNVERIFIED_CONTAM: hypothetical protein GTU68_031660 [Idotea baltica]|nr:hypothetical protein [Idotea baltica]